MEIANQKDEIKLKCKMCLKTLNKHSKNEVLIQCGTCNGHGNYFISFLLIFYSFINIFIYIFIFIYIYKYFINIVIFLYYSSSIMYRSNFRYGSSYSIICMAMHRL